MTASAFGAESVVLVLDNVACDGRRRLVSNEDLVEPLGVLPVLASICSVHAADAGSLGGGIVG